MKTEELLEKLKERAKEDNVFTQEVITLFREVKIRTDEPQLIEYPELNAHFKLGFQLEDFKQTMIGTDRFMITFVLKKLHHASY